jgi:hypothetical protein
MITSEVKNIFRASSLSSLNDSRTGAGNDLFIFSASLKKRRRGILMPIHPSRMF